MPDFILDTNVLIVASAADPSSPFDDTHVPPAETGIVFEWLAAFRADASRRMVWDDAWEIYAEYRRKLTDQDYGLRVLAEKMATARFVRIERDGDGSAKVPGEFDRFDRSDRKFLAVALADPEGSAIVNASDTDWLEIERELHGEGVEVIHLIERWLRESYGYPELASIAE
jgi:hypothetical protein